MTGKPCQSEILIRVPNFPYGGSAFGQDIHFNRESKKVSGQVFFFIPFYVMAGLCRHIRECSVHRENGARIFKLLKSPGMDSKESIPPAYVAWPRNRSHGVWRHGTVSP